LLELEELLLYDLELLELLLDEGLLELEELLLEGLDDEL
jgi:hypothetical protein